MIRAHIHSSCLIVTLGILAGLGPSSPAWAQGLTALPENKVCYAKSQVVTINDKMGGQFDILAYPDEQTSILFPSFIKLEESVWIDNDIIVKQFGNTANIVPLVNVARDKVVTVHLKTNLPTVVARVSISPGQADYRTHAVFVQTEAEAKRWETAIGEARSQGEYDMLEARAQRIREERRLVPVTRELGDLSSESAQIAWGEWYGRYFLMPFEIDRDMGETFHLSEVVVYDKFNKPHRGIVVGRQSQRGEDSVIATVRKGERYEAAVAVRFDEQGSVEPLRIEFRQPAVMKKAAPLIVAVTRWIPVTKEQEEREKRAKEQERLVQEREARRLARARRTIVGARAIYGAFWISDGLGQNRLDVTDFKGLGVRYTKGLHENWAVEAELAFGTTGQARFNEMMIGNDVGELTRDAFLGRVGFGGLFRWGTKFQPHVRLGVAGQGARFGAGFAGAAMDDESKFEFSMLLTAGGGLDVKLSEHVVTGLALSAETPLGGSDGDLFGRAFSVGAHVAYGW